MKIDKEYPATHSMETSWYIVDEEGNVGILDYNSNGPVPWTLTADACIEDILFGAIEERQIAFELTESQIMGMVSKVEISCINDLWFFQTVVQIDPTQEKAFIDICNHDDIENFHCINKNDFWYVFDAYQCFNNDGILVDNSSLKMLVESNIVKNFYKTKYFELEDEYDEQKKDVVHTELDGNIPYYVYHQAYWTKFPAKRVNVPKYPIKINQVPISLRSEIQQIKGSFAEAEFLQIAENVPCRSYDGNIVYNGGLYALYPSSNRKETYYLVDIPCFDFFPYCPKNYKCTAYTCFSREGCRATDAFTKMVTPTICLVKKPKNYIENVDDAIKNKSIEISLFPFFPNIKNYLSSEEIKKLPNTYIEEVWKETYPYFDMFVSKLNPRVIILDSNAQEIFESVHKIENHNVVINNISYPIYLSSEIAEYQAVIDEYSSMSYQGEIFELSISVEKMNKLLEEGKAHKINEK